MEKSNWTHEHNHYNPAAHVTEDVLHSGDLQCLFVSLDMVVNQLCYSFHCDYTLQLLHSSSFDTLTTYTLVQAYMCRVYVRTYVRYKLPDHEHTANCIACLRMAS